ncbi:hypothetical protein J437_LFUL013764 [Ladona fulva]|uniref:Ribosome-binding factor A n=1 Tax=Ladona fulva TaxID=123851 RepID=A0A8K0KEK8_LADFU|nr:hypothetical protein J437_LFUL013764 [Ladona fulva]
MSWCKVSSKINSLGILQFRSFSWSSVALVPSKEARVMNKFLKGSLKRRSWFPSKEISASSLPSDFLPRKGERNHRRINILNKLFMRYVSDIMSTGEVSNEIAGLRLEISKVKISSDFGTLNVFWVTKGTKIDSEIEDILQRNAGKLRHELTQLRVIGNVPAVQFVKDKSLSKLTELDGILSKADFGDEFEPSDSSFGLISEFVVKSEVPPEMQDNILKEDSIVDLDPLPPMATDVLGFNHEMVMQKVLRSMNKSLALHRRKPECSHSDGLAESDPDLPAESESEIQPSILGEGNHEKLALDKLELKKFVSRRMALQRKLSKPPKDHQWVTQPLHTEKFEDEDLDDEGLYGVSSKLRELEFDSDNFDDVMENNDSYLFNRKDT